MDVDTSNFDSEQRPDCLVSANMYAQYLWLGHCVFNLSDYKDMMLNFHDDEALAEQNTRRFADQVSISPETILIEQLAGVVKWARKEVDMQQPTLTAADRRELQVYLNGDVTQYGMAYARSKQIFKDDPDLAQVTSPFRDPMVIDGTIRYTKSSRSLQKVLSYTTIDRLLPGYPAAISKN